MGLCFAYGLPRHVVKDCPILQKKTKKQKQNANKVVATLRNSNKSSSDDNEDQVVNLGLTTNEEQIQEEVQCASSNEVDIS